MSEVLDNIEATVAAAMNLIHCVSSTRMEIKPASLICAHTMHQDTMGCHPANKNIGI